MKVIDRLLNHLKDKKDYLLKLKDSIDILVVCFKCKGYGHTKKQCDKHNKIVKQISKLDFEKDIINELMEIFNVKQ